ncbi:MAG TPA: hypothetical protein VGF67_07795 [Ktedonobacteraceae bacterium]|jgi:hypothetical protein
MNDPFGTRAARRAARAQRRAYRYRNPLRSLAGGIFILALLIGFANHGAWGNTGFLVLLFIGLAFSSLLGSFSTLRPRGIYGGLQSFIWLLGLALCFAIGFWPWILLPVAVTMILGALFNPITMGLAGASFLAASQAQHQPYQQPNQPGYQSYQQGYAGMAGTDQAYQEGAGQYSSQPRQEFEQPPTLYPGQQQELPPQEQQS